MPAPDIRVVAGPDAAPEPVLEAIKAQLRAFNRASAPDFYALRDLPENAPRPLHVVAWDAAGEVAGGVIGETCLAWLDIEILVVREADRGRGLGTRLMRAAEAEGVRRGCRYAALDTASWQARPFYEKLGYAVVGTIEDRTGFGHAKYYLTRRIG